LSVSTIDHIMQGFVPPRPIICRIAEALGVDPKYLLISAGLAEERMTTEEQPKLQS
jgi:transcriptional regulator with XRE-family HTH domain